MTNARSPNFPMSTALFAKRWQTGMLMAMLLAAMPAFAQTVAVLAPGGELGYFSLVAPTTTYARVTATIANAVRPTGLAYDGTNLLLADSVGGNSRTRLRVLNAGTGVSSTPGVPVSDTDNPSGANILLSGFTFNGGGVLHGYSYFSDKTETINLSTGTGAFLGGALSGQSNFTDDGATRGRMAFLGSNLYGAYDTTSADGLYQFNLTNGAATFLGNGGQAGAYANMALFSHAGTLYGISGITLYTVNAANGSLSTVATIGGSNVPTSFIAAVAAPVPAITVSPASGLTTTEAGGTATFTVVLNSPPSANVGIAFSSSDVTEGNVAPASLTFTSGNWNVAQNVTITGVDDAVVDGTVAYTIVTAAATSSDPNYNGIDPTDVAVSNSDNDAAGIAVSPTTGLVTTESGGSANFMVVLTSQPSANVGIALSSSDVTEGNVAPASLTFTSGNWNVAQSVTITGVDDAVVDGTVAYTIVTAAATSSDPNYNDIDPTDVAVSNSDNDAAGIAVSPTTGLVTTESGGSANFMVVLTSQPSANVGIALSSSDVTEGNVAPASLTFTSGNWNVAQSVTITGVDDAVVDGTVAYTIVTAAATSSDPNYNGINPTDVAVSNSDNDAAGITVSPTTGLATTEAGGTASFTVVLNSQPSANVTLGLSTSDATEGTVAPNSIVFTSGNWNVAQSVTVTGVDDALADGTVAYMIVTAAATSADANYNGVNPTDIDVSNSDDDSAGITVTPTTGLVTSEAGATASFTMVLNSEPSADVEVGLSSSDTTEGTPSAAVVAFTAANWNVAQAVTVTGVDDLLADGTVAYTVITAAATSADVNYAGVNAADVAVSNTDNDSIQFDGLTATGSGAASILLIDGGTCSFDLAQTAFIPVSGLQLPSGQAFPHGAARMRLQGCAVGASLTVELRLPSIAADARLWKLFAASPAVGITSTAVDDQRLRYTLMDGGALDADGVANGVIVDPVALGVPSGVATPSVVPANDAWALAAAALMLALFGAAALRVSRKGDGGIIR